MKMSSLIPLFQAALREYRDGYMAARNLAARSRREYQTDLVKFLRFLQDDCGIRQLASVSPYHVQAYLAKLDKQGIAGVSRRRKLTVIRTFFAWLRSAGILVVNPARRVLFPKPDAEAPRALNKAEYEHLLAIVTNRRDKAIIQLLLQTGIRLSEIQRLTLADLTLPPTINPKNLGVLRIRGQGKKSRTVLLNWKAIESLSQWLKMRPETQLDALFISNRCQPLSPRSYQYMVEKYLKTAGIKGASVHTLRHTFATQHLIMGTDPATIQEVLGNHSADSIKPYLQLVKNQQAQHIQDHVL